MLEYWSQVEEALRDTLVHKAEGPAFRALCRLYGFDKSPEISQRSWRKALHEIAYGRRGTFVTTRNALEGALRDFDEVFDLEVDTANPERLVAQAGAGTFQAQHVNRLVRTPYGLHFTVSISGSGDYLGIAPLTTEYWNGTDAWTFTGTEQFTGRMLPFLIYERNPGPTYDGWDDRTYKGVSCLVEVELLSDAITYAPASYLQDPPGVATPVDLPPQGHLLADSSVPGNPEGAGPYPIYLFDGNPFVQTQKQFQRNLAAGVLIVFKRAPV